MVRQAKEAGIALSGPGGLLKALAARVVEAALGEELNEHLGDGRHDPVGRGSGNSRNGTRLKMLIIDNVGTIEIHVPRNRNWNLRTPTSQEAPTPSVGHGPDGPQLVREGGCPYVVCQAAVGRFVVGVGV